MKESTDPSSCVTSNREAWAPNLAEYNERLLARAIRTETGCLLWTGGMDLKKGYGVIRGSSGTTRAHRLAYELVNGPIPEGMHIDHTCHNNQMWCPGGPACLHRRCINPEHLEAVTPEENFRRGRVGLRSSMSIRRTECHQGHPLDGDNVRIRRNGTRECRTCERNRDRRRRSEASTPAPTRAACSRGHLLTEDNIHRQGSIVRCLTCRKEAQRRNRQSKQSAKSGGTS